MEGKISKNLNTASRSVNIINIANQSNRDVPDLPTLPKIGAIGERDAFFAFKAIGIDTFFPTCAEEIKSTIEDLEKKGYSIILISESFAVKAEKTIQSFATRPYPIILLVPDAGGTNGYGINRILDNMSKAVGSTAGLR
ncbi:MAG: V-type ATP synthase subunit F [Firmicutes bacterium]|nr:V-type ATP synthase subunit F [Bacillota bacterium]